MKKGTIRAQLTGITISIISLFMIASSILFILFLVYLGHVIERVYGIDDDVLVPFYRIIIIVFILLLILGVVLSVLGSNLIVKQVNQNVSSFVSKIQLIQERDTKQRLPKLDNEFDVLGSEFNKMMDQIESVLDKQNQFVSDASHELKTPLAILLGNIEMLDRWGKQDEAILDQSLKTCHSEIYRMISLSKQLLSLSSEIHMTNDDTIEMDELILARVADYKNLYSDFTITYKSEGNNKIAMKEEHFVQILTILLDNAVKYSREDSRRICIHTNDNILEVKDYGIGIEQDRLSHIFDRFYRVDESRNGSQNSFGLGLSILKRMEESYQFSITVESKINEYTNFIIKFKEV